MEDKDLPFDLEEIKIDPSITLDSVVSQDKAIKELREVRDTFQFPQVFEFWNASIPGGVLLVGESGCGKTTAVRGLANEAGAAVVELNYMEIASMYVDRSLELIREFIRLVEEVARKEPVIWFIDEIEAMFSARTGNRQAHEHDLRRTNALLTWMDGGLATKKNIMLIGATNSLGEMDVAARRAGRFDRIIQFEKLTNDGMLDILRFHVKKRKSNGTVTLIEEFDFEELRPALKPDFRGADLEDVVKRALLDKGRLHTDQLRTTRAKGDISTLLAKKNLRPGPVTMSDIYNQLSNYDLKARGAESEGLKANIGFTHV